MNKSGSNAVTWLVVLGIAAFLLTQCGRADAPESSGYNSSSEGQSTLGYDGTNAGSGSDYSLEQEEGHDEQRLDEGDYYYYEQQRQQEEDYYEWQRQQEEDYYYEQQRQQEDNYYEQQRQRQEDDYNRQQQEDYYYEQQRQQDYYNQ